MSHPILRPTVVSTSLLLAASAWAGSTGNTTPGATVLNQHGSGRAETFGDFVSSNTPSAPNPPTPLNTFYRFGVEVPPGLTNLRIQIFDADVLNASGGQFWDVQNGGSINTAVQYQFIDPTGTVRTTINCAAGGCGAGPNRNNTWTGATYTTNIVPGHWTVRANTSSAITAGDDVNYFGLRADDGNSGAGGTEINVYAHSFFETGASIPNGNFPQRTYTMYPYVTAGCEFRYSEFDFDENLGDGGRAVFTSRSGAFTQTFENLSVDNSWNSNIMTGFVSPNTGAEFGLWTAALTIGTAAGTTIASNNYATNYLLSDLTALPPPTAQPEPNSFRLYLPTDGGARPNKPFVEMFARVRSGPNPPTVGMPTFTTITIRVTNPSPTRPIVFSTPNNVVTSNVPGTGVTYNGNATFTAGTTIVSQPAIGGTGNVVWNPGTVAPGGVVVLSYDIRVVPGSVGQTLLLTADAGSGNGSRAQFIDETGDATNATGLFVFGPLCRLTVTEGTVTHASVSDFDAVVDRQGRVEVQFSTASEAGSVGFDLRRRLPNGQWTRVTEHSITALHFAPQGGRYRVLDPGAEPGRLYTYELIELERNGSRRQHGPFTVFVGDYGVGAPMAGGIEKTPGALARPSASLAATDGEIGPTSDRELSVGTRGAGMVRLTAAEIANALSISEEAVGPRIAAGDLALTRQGRPVAWLPQGDELWFYAEPSASPFAAEDVVRVSLAKGEAMTVRADEGADEAVTSVRTEVVLEENTFAGLVAAPDPEQDFWFWKVLSPGGEDFARHDLPIELGGAMDDAAPLELEIGLHGATPSEHRIALRWNDQVVGSVSFTGAVPHVARIQVPAGLAQAGANTLTLSAERPDGVDSTVVYLDRVSVEYARSPALEAGELVFVGRAGTTIRLASAQPDALRIFDVTDPARPVVVSPEVVGVDHVAWLVGPSDRRFLAVAPDGLRVASFVRPVSAERPSLREGDYVIVTSRALAAPARRLAERRRAEGLVPVVAFVEDLYDEFSAGLRDPRALRAYLADANARWQTKPRYVVLAGAGTYDYRDHLGLGGNHVPPLMARTADGLFASDRAFLPTTAVEPGLGAEPREEPIVIGRLPAANASELDAMVEKIVGYEEGDRDTNRVLVVSDKRDEQLNFTRARERILPLIPAFTEVLTVGLDEVQVARARDSIRAGLESGVSLLAYMGHGGLDRLGKAGFFTVADLSGVTNQTLPVVAGMTCTINRFEVPGAPSLGAELVKKPDGGAIAVWSASGLSTQGDAGELLSRFLVEALHRRGRLGDQIRRAEAIFAAAGGSPEILRLYNLIGDPALTPKVVLDPVQPRIDPALQVAEDSGFETGPIERTDPIQDGQIEHDAPAAPVPEGPGPEAETGCGCAAAEAPGARLPLLGLVVAAALLLRRRRQL